MYWGIHMCQKNEMHQWTRWISPCSRVFRMLVVEMIHRYIREIVSGSGKNCAARMELNRNRAFLQKGRTLRYDVEDRSQLMMIWGKSIPGRRKSTCKCPELGMSLGGWRWGKEAREAGSQREWKVRFFFFFFFLTFRPCCMAYGILVSWPGIKPLPPAVEARNLNHWTAREFPRLLKHRNQ